jgi:protein arginine N-methyltransferase 3
MSIRLPPTSNEPFEDSSSQEEDEDDQTWDDFAEESIGQQPCCSLFDDEKFLSVTDALEYDRSKYGFDLGHTCSRLRKLSFP